MHVPEKCLRNSPIMRILLVNLYEEHEKTTEHMNAASGEHSLVLSTTNPCFHIQVVWHSGIFSKEVKGNITGVILRK